MKTFKEADILLPGKEVNMEKWSVIACDQFTSEPESVSYTHLTLPTIA